MDIVLPPTARSYWRAELTTNRIVTEQFGQDWSLDLVATGDVLKIKTLILHCPNGQVAALDFALDQAGTAFQLKQAAVGGMSGERFVLAHIIGKVVDKETGACMCYAWDALNSKLIGWHDNVKAMEAWKIGHLAYAVQGFVGVAE